MKFTFIFDNNRLLLPKNENRSPELIDSSTIFVSLYLFLLIFFVLLNATSKHNITSHKQAIQSIKGTFANEVSLDKFKSYSNRGQNIQSDLQIKEILKIRQQEHIHSILTKISNYQIPLNKFDNNNLLKFKLPLNDVFHKNTVLLKKNHLTLFNDIANTIRTSDNASQIKLEILVSNRDLNDTHHNLIDMIGKINNLLLRSGADPNLFLIGIDYSTEESMIIDYYYTEN